MPRGDGLGSFSLWITPVLLSSCSRTPLGTQRQVDPRRRGKSKRDAHCLKVQIVNVKNISVRMTSVGQDITSVSIPCRPIEVIVLFNQALQLALNVCDLAGRKFILVKCHLGSLQIAQKSCFFRGQKQKCATGSFGSTSGTSNTL